jgi:hypothetical protein
VTRELIQILILILCCAAAALPLKAQQNNCLPTPVAPAAANNISPNGKLLCVTNESGKLDIYTLADMQRVEQFVFTGSVTLVEFNEDGKKLIVLTSNQTAHVFDISSL